MTIFLRILPIAMIAMASSAWADSFICTTFSNGLSFNATDFNPALAEQDVINVCAATPGTDYVECQGDVSCQDEFAPAPYPVPYPGGFIPGYPVYGVPGYPVYGGFPGRPVFGGGFGPHPGGFGDGHGGFGGGHGPVGGGFGGGHGGFGGGGRHMTPNGDDASNQ